MPWITLTSYHVRDRLASDELDVIESVGGGSGDRLTGILAQVTSLVRSKVNACHKNSPGVAGTIPEECLHAAATIAASDLRASIPSMGGDDENKLRSEALRMAHEFLKDVSKCEIGIEDEVGTVAGSDSGCYGGDVKHSF